MALVGLAIGLYGDIAYKLGVQIRGQSRLRLCAAGSKGKDTNDRGKKSKDFSHFRCFMKFLSVQMDLLYAHEGPKVDKLFESYKAKNDILSLSLG